ncbi:DUF1963 domain-containing protein [Bacteroides sp.]|uniref:DUF1963 domain-containing protein n=1 Tax=Bacteroides sp. TaxID=29523 RepID=UPI003457D54C
MIKTWITDYLGALLRFTYELSFGDCGDIYFYISHQDLKNKDFRNLKFELQCY